MTFSMTISNSCRSLKSFPSCFLSPFCWQWLLPFQHGSQKSLIYVHVEPVSRCAGCSSLGWHCSLPPFALQTTLATSRETFVDGWMRGRNGGRTPNDPAEEGIKCKRDEDIKDGRFRWDLKLSGNKNEKVFWSPLRANDQTEALLPTMQKNQRNITKQGATKRYQTHCDFILI